MNELSRDWSKFTLTEEARARQKRLEAAALEVFGDLNPEGAWILKQTSEFGGWATPSEVAAQSEERLRLVLTRLEELKQVTVPRWRPQVSSRGRKRR